jgi:uncharacterized membrane protein YraQ (UPF0718 family)
MNSRSGVSISASILVGSLTPLCACGTMALVLSMFLSVLSWGPVMAFLISSPLSSPSEFVFESVFLGRSFAVSMLAASVALGATAGMAARYLEKNTSFFEGQFIIGGSSCCGAAKTQDSACSCGKKTRSRTFLDRFRVREFLTGMIRLGLLRILPLFVLFIAIGKIAEYFIPTAWITGLFGAGKGWSIPLAATLGLPLYLTDSSALPMLRMLLDGGAGQGALLAFLIAGKATGVPVIAGMSTILGRRAIAFYIAFIYIGSIVVGFAHQGILSLI